MIVHEQYVLAAKGWLLGVCPAREVANRPRLPTPWVMDLRQQPVAPRHASYVAESTKVHRGEVIATAEEDPFTSLLVSAAAAVCSTRTEQKTGTLTNK